ncbi:alginate export family protein [Kordiimonas sp. SCSIO 12610]|uniref:alginate export family protein n=1 Tax=Kordiimonas sp. SCSIO 12610 TaxID=2829597 RepID=UPI00210DC0DC|nr:alginate export family protein [Kordiimonas sp. SCSIO 12610]UTW54651.1 alginate export family protein [Kordiimonas sp. SCSIO 12610]
MYRVFALKLSLLVSLLHPHNSAFGQEPLRLNDYVGKESGLDITATYRIRYELLDGRFRANQTGSDQILVERFLLSARYSLGNFYIGGELQDSRQQLADSETPIGTDDVNPFELLQAYVGWRQGNAIVAGDALDISLGRITIDAGSRRLAARNGFRNTINGFNGLHITWQGPKEDTLQAFYTLPVDRLPSSKNDLLGNDVVFDRENFNVRFWGLVLAIPNFINGLNSEFYIFGLQEDDRADLQTRDRNLYTPGFRLFRDKAVGVIDYELETAIQFGKAAFSSAPTALALKQLAHFYHAHLGYTFDNAWKSRIVFQYDFASGDNDPFDNDNGRFETLFGARRFEFGPTGIFGPLARSNINSPGIRFEINPSDRWRAFLGYRAAFLASSQDALLTVGLVDPTGSAGSSIGHQIEASMRYALLPGNISLEIGAAYLDHGRFLLEAPSASPDQNTFYAYTQITANF